MLYVFGDSFAVDIQHMDESNRVRELNKLPQFQSLNNNWVNLVSNKLTGTVTHNNYAMAGCSNEYIFHTLMQHKDKFKSNDCVIVVLTDCNRRWFVEQYPEFANWTNCDFDLKAITKNQNNAIQQYGKYLDNELASKAIYDAIFWATVNVAQQVASNNTKFLIIPGFHSIQGIQGTLVEVTAAEFDNNKTLNQYYKKTSDDRWNHLSKANHKILADKVIDFFNDTNHDINLNHGFIENIYRGI
jgi:hypothetical protein|tara:strand:- start:1211 stop:1939 length:729 start_codon:yes stop_codon:yes gene_type:complete